MRTRRAWPWVPWLVAVVAWTLLWPARALASPSSGDEDALQRGWRAVLRGDLAQAVVEAGLAAAEAPERDDKAQSEALLLRARALFEAGDMEEAGLALDAAKARLAGTPHAATLITALTLEGEVAHRVGAARRAEEILTEAITWAEVVRVDSAEPWIAYGRLLALARRDDAALASFERARRACRGERDARATAACAARVDAWTAAVFEARGEAHRARGLLDGALAELSAENWALERLRALTTYVEVALALGDEALAAARGDEALGLARRIRAPALGARAREVRAEVHLAAGEGEAARSLLAEARSIWLKLGSPTGVAASRLLSAREALGRGAGDEAALHLDAAEEAAAQGADAELLLEAACLQVELARLEGAPGEERRALEVAIGRSPPPATLARLEGRLGELALARGEVKAAVAHLEAATEAAERVPTLRLAPSLRERAMAERHALYDQLVAAYMQVSPGAPTPPEVLRRAVLASERSAARALTDTLERSRVLRESPDARAALAALIELDARQTLALADARRDGGALAPEVLDGFSRQRQALEASVLGLAPRALSERRPERIQAAVGDFERRVLADVVIAKYHLGEAGSHLFLWTRAGLVHHPLPPRRVIVERVARFADAIAVPPGARSGAQRAALRRDGEVLADWLVAPAFDALAAARPGQGEPSTTRLVLVPHRELRALPFDALPVKTRGAGRRWLVELAEVSTAPSLAALVALEDERLAKQGRVRHPLVAFGDALYSKDHEVLPRLEATADEARQASQYLQGDQRIDQAGSVFLQDEATEARLKQIALGRYRFVHLAAHGFAPGGLPAERARSSEDEGFLLLGRGGSEDGRVTVGEVLSLGLDADLVVLSACSSGRGATEPGDGLGGLVNAFLHAGGAGVIATLWPIEDRHAAETMKGLYRGLAAGHDPASALRTARLELIAAGGARRGPMRGDALTRGMGGVSEEVRGRVGAPRLDPFYWAAWTLTGATGDTLGPKR